MGAAATSNQPVIEQYIKIPIEDYTMMKELIELLKSEVKKLSKKEWLNTEDAAAYINKSVSHLRERLKDKIGFSQPGTEIMFKRTDLDAYLMKHYTPAKE